MIERWMPGGDWLEMLSEQLTWRPAGAAEPLTIDLGAFFADALDRKV